MSTNALERRSCSRRQNHGIVLVRVRPGHNVAIIDVSAAGILVEGTCRLRPGSAIELVLQRAHQPAECIRGRVARCGVSGLRADSIRYRGAIAFDRRLPWLLESESSGYGVPDSASTGADATRIRR